MKYESDTRAYCLNLVKNDANISNRIENIFFNFIHKSYYFILVYNLKIALNES